jgi:hypothetical protein
MCERSGLVFGGSPYRPDLWLQRTGTRYAHAVTTTIETWLRIDAHRPSAAIRSPCSEYFLAHVADRLLGWITATPR